MSCLLQSSNTCSFIILTVDSSDFNSAYILTIIVYICEKEHYALSNVTEYIFSLVADLGVSCAAASTTCKDANAVCGTGSICICKSSHYDDNGLSLGGTCRQSKGFNGFMFTVLFLSFHIKTCIYKKKSIM
jgi:hypothetical protein